MSTISFQMLNSLSYFICLLLLLIQMIQELRLIVIIQVQFLMLGINYPVLLLMEIPFFK